MENWLTMRAKTDLLMTIVNIFDAGRLAAVWPAATAWSVDGFHAR